MEIEVDLVSFLRSYKSGTAGFKLVCPVNSLSPPQLQFFYSIVSLLFLRAIRKENIIGHGTSPHIKKEKIHNKTLHAHSALRLCKLIYTHYLIAGILMEWRIE